MYAKALERETNRFYLAPVGRSLVGKIHLGPFFLGSHDIIRAALPGPSRPRRQWPMPRHILAPRHPVSSWLWLKCPVCHAGNMLASFYLRVI